MSFTLNDVAFLPRDEARDPFFLDRGFRRFGGVLLAGARFAGALFAGTVRLVRPLGFGAVRATDLPADPFAAFGFLAADRLDPPEAAVSGRRGAYVSIITKHSTGSGRLSRFHRGRRDRPAEDDAAVNAR